MVGSPLVRVTHKTFSLLVSLPPPSWNSGCFTNMNHPQKPISNFSFFFYLINAFWNMAISHANYILFTFYSLLLYPFFLPIRVCSSDFASPPPLCLYSNISEHHFTPGTLSLSLSLCVDGVVCQCPTILNLEPRIHILIISTVQFNSQC